MTSLASCAEAFAADLALARGLRAVHFLRLHAVRHVADLGDRHLDVLLRRLHRVVPQAQAVVRGIELERPHVDAAAARERVADGGRDGDFVRLRQRGHFHRELAHVLLAAARERQQGQRDSNHRLLHVVYPFL